MLLISQYVIQIHVNMANVWMKGIGLPVNVPLGMKANSAIKVGLFLNNLCDPLFHLKQTSVTRWKLETELLP